MRDPSDKLDTAGSPLASKSTPSESDSESNPNLPDDALVDYLVFRAAEETDKRITEREASRRQRVHFILAIVGLVGFGTLVTVANTLIETVVEAELVEATDELNESLRRELAYQQLVSSALTLRSSDVGFSVADRDQAQALLREIVGAPEMLRRPGLANIVEDILDAFVAADLRTHVDEIEGSYRPILMNFGGTVYTLLSHYGKRVVGSPLPVEDQDPEDLDRFQLYAGVADQAGWPELAIFYRALVEFKRAGLSRTAVGEEILDDRHLLDEQDRASFLQQIELHSTTEGFQPTPTAEGNRIAETVRAMLETYPELTEEIQREGQLAGVDQGSARE